MVVITVLYNFLIYLRVQHKQIEFQLERDAFHRIWLKLVLEWTFEFHHVLTIWLLSPLRGRNGNSFERLESHVLKEKKW